MNNLPFYVYAVFVATLLAAIFLYYKATNGSRRFLYMVLGWSVIQTFISVTGFYKVTTSMPPRFMLLVLPPLVAIVICFCTKPGRAFIDSLRPDWLALYSIIRLPVEFTLLWLSVHKAVPELMTFEGRNFDILSGITAPLVYYFGYVKRTLGRGVLLLWNFACLGLLINIVTNALLAAPGPQQMQAFDQPNVAILYAPFTLLPAVLVPLVLFSHSVNIRKLANHDLLESRINRMQVEP